MIIIEMGGSTLFLSSTKPCTFSSWDQNPPYAGKMGFVKSRARNFERICLLKYLRVITTNSRQKNLIIITVVTKTNN